MRLSQQRVLIILLAISIAVVLLNDIIFNETPEIFSFGDELGAALSNLSLAYISSYIFYYVVVVIKEKRDRQNIRSIVYEWTKLLIGRAYWVYHEIVSSAGGNQPDFNIKTITKEKYRDLCGKVNPNEIHKNYVLGSITNPEPATHGQLIYHNSVSHVKTYTEKIFNYMPFLDTELVRLINQLHSSKFHLVSQILNIPTGNKDFSVYADNMYEFLEHVRELDCYNETVNKEFAKKRR